MPVTIGSNIASLKAQRQLARATDALSSIYEKLSSGQRINKASDDAASLAISQDLRSKSRVFDQAIRNGNDGQSLLTIADSALDNLTSVLIRIRELAEQSANGTYSNKQRSALDAEAQALANEYSRIVRSTSFNGVNIFDGSLGSGVRLQLGYGIDGSINARVGGAIGTGSFGGATSYTTESQQSLNVTVADLNNDGITDLITSGISDTNTGIVTVRLGTGGGNFGAATSYADGSIFKTGVSVGDLNNDGVLDLISVGQGAGSRNISVRLGTGSGTFGASTSYVSAVPTMSSVVLGDINGDGNIDIVSAGGDTVQGSLSVMLGTGTGSFGAEVTYLSENGNSNSVVLGDLNGDGNLDLITAGYLNSGSYDGYATVRLGTGTGTFGAATSYATESAKSYGVALGDLNGDGSLDLVTAGYSDANVGYVTVRLGSGTGSFGTAVSYQTGMNQSISTKLGDLNGDGILDIITAGFNGAGVVGTLLGTGSGTFSNGSTFTSETGITRTIALGDLDEDGVVDVITAGTSSGSSDGYATVRLASTLDGLSSILPFSLSTKADSLQSMTMLDRSIANISKQRGIIGAYQSRLNTAISTLRVTKENFEAAASRIMDVDVAEESSNLVRTQILQQVATAVLSQANLQPSIVLKLLSDD